MSWASTIACHDGDWSVWHQGRPWYYVWAFVLRDPLIETRLQVLREAFGAVLVPAGDRQAHITVQALGFIENPFDDPVILAQFAALASMWEQPGPMYTGAPASFASALYLSVHDHAGQLARLRAVLESVQPEQRTEPYTPHVTAGLYACTLSRQDVEQLLRGVPAWEPVPLVAPMLSLVRYSTHSIQSPLQTVAEYDLHSHDNHWNITDTTSQEPGGN